MSKLNTQLDFSMQLLVVDIRTPEVVVFTVVASAIDVQI